MNTPEPSAEDIQAAAKLIAEIREAFHGVVLGNGIGLWEAQALDDYEDEEGQAKARARDEKLDWSLISTEDLSYCYSSPSFFDADGMRFHLPAFMIDDIRKTISNQYRHGSTIFALTQLDDFKRDKFILLCSKQRSSIVSYMRWHMSRSSYSPDYENIVRALQEYWGKYL